MFLNYLAGVISLVLAISSFVPWITIWFYSLKGIESVYGIGILLVGLLGLTVSAFQHLSGKIRGRAFIFSSIAALVCEAFYFKKMAQMGQTLNEILGTLTDIFGEQLMLKVQQVLGEQWSKILVRLGHKILGDRTSVDSFDFVGGGLILAVISSVCLLAVGVILEKNKTIVD